MSMTTIQPLSNLQQELLKLFSSNIKDEDLLYIKRFIAKYFAEKAIDEANNIWEERGYNNETMKQWLNEANSTKDAT